MIPINVEVIPQSTPGSLKFQPIQTAPVVEAVLKATKKGGVLGKKRGKYNKNSRVTQWRRRTERQGGRLPTGNSPSVNNQQTELSTSQEPPFSPTTSNASSRDSCDINHSPTQNLTATDPLIQSLKFELSHVKNQRLCPHSTPYEYLRHLSVLRFLEWTTDGEKSESDAAHELATLLWEHKIDHPESSITHKANLIRKWAKEYRKDGKLGVNAQGQHTKTMSTLALDHIAKAAQKELAKMIHPGPGPLRMALQEKIFPEFGITDPIPTENTCRNYMEKWGWKPGGYRQWIPGKKKLLDVGADSDDGNIASDENVVSDETSILETHVSKQKITPSIKPSWNAPIPSPTTAILSVASSQPTIGTHMSESYGDISPLNVPSPITTFSDTSMSMTDRMAPSWPSWPQYAYPGVMPMGYLTNQPQMYAFQMQPGYSTIPSLESQQGLQYQEQAQRRYAPKSLDHLVPDPPQMQGHRPTFNGLPVSTFTPPTSQTTPLEPFHHDTTFPGRISRQSMTNNQQNPSFNDPSSHQYLPS